MNQPTPSTPHRFLLLAALLVAACRWSPTPPSAPAPSPASTAPQDLEDVNIGSFSAAIDYGPYLVARSKGWFEEALKPLGAEPQYTTFQSLAPINESFATGRVDVVFEAEPPAIIGRAAGTDIRIVAIGCTLAQEVIVPANSKTAKIADLKGMKVAVLAGTSSHYGLLKIARAAGLQDSDLTVVDMVPPRREDGVRDRPGGGLGRLASVGRAGARRQPGACAPGEQRADQQHHGGPG